MNRATVFLDFVLKLTLSKEKWAVGNEVNSVL